MTEADLLCAAHHSRMEVKPSGERGVYGLFLLPEVKLGWLKPRQDGLIYVGKAEGEGGFAQRCHFVGSTLNHSPRKSLAVLLKDSHNLELRAHPNGKWGLTPNSDRRLSEWMFKNLRVAYLPTTAPAEVEKRLVLALAPTLNLNIRKQGPDQERISRLRKIAKASVQADEAIIFSRNQASLALASPPSAEMGIIEGACAIADHFGLNPKQYRAALRRQMFIWHDHWQSWTVPQGSKEWRDMIAVAEQISGKRWNAHK